MNTCEYTSRDLHWTLPVLQHADGNSRPKTVKYSSCPLTTVLVSFTDVYSQYPFHGRQISARGRNSNVLSSQPPSHILTTVFVPFSSMAHNQTLFSLSSLDCLFIHAIFALVSMTASATTSTYLLQPLAKHQHKIPFALRRVQYLSLKNRIVCL